MIFQLFLLPILLATFCWIIPCQSNIDDPNFLFRHDALDSAEIAQIHAQLSLDSIRHVHSRSLQTSNTTTVSDPTKVCSDLNSGYTRLGLNVTCSCSRFGKDETEAICTQQIPTCNAVSTYCISLVTTSYTTAASLSRATTSCSNVTTTTTPNSTSGQTQRVTCVQLQPKVVGDYSQIATCDVTLNGQGCKSCKQVDLSCVQSSSVFNASTQPYAAAMSINCCNVVPDAVQVCGPVATTGIFTNAYDTVSADKKGTCPSGAAERASVAIAAAMVMAGCALWIL
jgi:hypothetical protein